MTNHMPPAGKNRFLLSLFGLLAIGLTASRAGAIPSLDRDPLSAFDLNVHPWEDMDAEQPYCFIGATPREMALGLPQPARPRIPTRLKAIGTRELVRVREALGLPDVELEIWPGYDGWGYLTWNVARYRKPGGGWTWLESTLHLPRRNGTGAGPVQVVLPEVLDPAKADDLDRIYNQFPAGVYDRPEFESVFWVTRDKKEALAAWLRYGQEGQIRSLCQTKGCLAISLNPPARFNDRPITFVARVSASTVTFPTGFDWVDEIRSRPHPSKTATRISDWPSDLGDRIGRDLGLLTGEQALTSPLTGRRIDFTKQSSSQLDNQLQDVAVYLKERHEQLGFNRHAGWEVRLEKFTWNGIDQFNVIATLRGSAGPERNRPVLLSAHFDKAISEDTYASTGERVTTPGADDNITGVAALLRAAEILSGRYRTQRPAHDIVLLYDTGEEFPAGTLGARYYTSHDLLAGHRDIQADINLDMIGFRTQGDRIYQINAGFSAASWDVATLAWNLANLLPGRWTAEVRYPWSKESYLSQTSGSVFDWAGYPTVLLNEHLNLARKLNPHYHQSTDTVNFVDRQLAAVQTKLLIETAAALAEAP
jgi:hypothetical protein